MNGVRPVAVAAREQRREAKKVLSDIDALLRSVEIDGDDIGDEGGRNPRATEASVGFGRGVTNSSTVAASARRGRARATPGPGSYAVESATASVKPRVVSATFQLGACSCRFQSCSCSSANRRRGSAANADSESSALCTPTTRAEAGLGVNAKAAVQYRARATPNYRTFEQKQRVHVIMAAKHRWKRVGFHSVSHRLVERRVDVGHVAFNVDTDGEKLAQVRLRRKIRAWKLVEAPKQPPKQQSDTVASKNKAVGHGNTHRTAQWMRARASRLLRESERRKNAEPAPSHDARSMSRSLRELPAHDMEGQSGRERVRCRSKHLKAVLRFCDDVLKEQPRPVSDSERQATRSNEKKSQFAPFSVAVGRNGARFDQATGLYLIAQNDPQSLLLEPTDTSTRSRARTCAIASYRGDPRASDDAAALAYSPKYSLVDRSARGHRFVAFETQRPRSATPRGDDGEQVILAPDLAEVYERQVFPRAPKQLVDYHKMLGRLD